ncbi:MAG: hypothetical protein ACYTKD_18480 [Planctomycetota bacterium]|jgi:hypothetical protein
MATSRGCLFLLVLTMLPHAARGEEQADQELALAKQECDAALHSWAGGRSLYGPPDYDLRRLYPLLESPDARIRNLAADTLATLARWHRSVYGPRGGEGLRQGLSREAEPRIRAAVLASVLACREWDRASTKEGRSYIAPMVEVTAPAFREVMTGPVSPPYLEEIVNNFQWRPIPRELVPEDAEGRRLLARRAIEGVALKVRRASTRVAADLPRFWLELREDTESHERLLQRFRQRDWGDAAGSLHSFGVTLPACFWDELAAYARVTADVEFRKFLVSRFLKEHVKAFLAQSKPLPEQVVSILTRLSEDWVEEVSKEASNVLKRIK